jgi:hypothetical protein
MLSAKLVGGTHVARVPLQPPLQAANRQPLAGIARSVNREPALNDLEHVGAHSTRPRPAIVTRTGILVGPKTALTARADDNVTLQPLLPVHAPLQRMKREPGTASAASETSDP